MSSDDDDSITVAPVPPVIRRRPDEEEGMHTHLLPPARVHGDVGCLGRLGSSFCGRHGLCDEENRSYYFNSCVYLFFCHAVDTVLLHICCCHCLKSCLPTPGIIEPRNGPQKVFTFCMKQLSNLWASALLLFIARQAFLRPFDVMPMLGTCTINDFEVQWPPADAMAMAGSAAATHPILRFNLTTHLLFKNSHQHYGIGYNYPAAAVYYAGEKLGPVDDEIPAFRQDPLRSTVVDQVIVGRLRNASTTVVETFTGERAKGRFHMVMRIRVTLSYKYWPFKEDYFTFYDCPLCTPVPNTGEPALSTPVYCNSVKI